jgi:hypothetical protein
MSERDPDPTTHLCTKTKTKSPLAIILFSLHDLLLQFRLVRGNIALPERHTSILTQPNLLGDLTNKSKVVTNKHNTAVKIVDCTCK